MVAPVWLRGTPALSSESEGDEGSGNGDASVEKIDVDIPWIGMWTVNGGGRAFVAAVKVTALMCDLHVLVVGELS